MMKKILVNILTTILTVTLLASLSAMPVMAKEFTPIEIDFENNSIDSISGTTTDNIVAVSRNADTNNKALKFGNAWNATLETGIDINSENTYEISFSIYADNMGTQYGVFLGKNALNNILLLNSDGSLISDLGAGANAWSGTTMFKTTAKKWIDVTVIIDCSNDKATATFTDGTNTNTNTGKLRTTADYSTLVLWNSKATDVCYIDDIKVRTADEKPSFIPIEINFDDGNISKLNKPVTITGENDTPPLAGKFNDNWTIFNTEVSDKGIYKLSYSIYPANNKAQYAMFLGDKTALLRLDINSPNFVIATTTSNGWGAGSPNELTYEAEKWYDVEVIIDHAESDGAPKGTVYVTVSDGSVSVTKSCAISPDSADFNKFMFGCFNGQGEYACYIDNICFEKIIKRPQIDDNRITMIDVNGEYVSGIDTVVTPALDTLILDFGTELISRTVKDITFTDSDGEEVAATTKIEAAKGTYTIIIDGTLKPNEEYTITVPETVENVFNETLGNEFVYTFKTSKGEYLVNLSGLYDEYGEKLISIGDITYGKNMVVDIDYINSTEDGEELVCLISYYNDDMMVYSEIAESTEIAALSKDKIKAEFTAPSMEDVADVKVFVWNTAEGGIAVGDAINPFGD